MTMSVWLDRQGTRESCHVLWAVSASATGELLTEATPGDGDRRVFLRSAAKPFQAAAAVADGVLDTLDLGPQHLAVACSSHDGREEATALVEEILLAAGLDRSALHPGDDGQGGPLQHQCSGNHALALAWCVVNRWPTESYLDAAHPAQLAMSAIIAVAAGEPPVTAPDNCGMTAHLLPLRAIATAFARLGVGDERVRGLDRVGAAMRSFPHLVRWPGEVDTELMSGDSRLVAKEGAEAILGIGSSDGVGVALRVGDGAHRALAPGGLAAARRWLDVTAQTPGLSAFEPVVVLDAKGSPIGTLSPVWDGAS
jgi:L-asparaginase